jgi:hypothetical protein
VDRETVSARKASSRITIDGFNVLERLKGVARQRPWLPDHYTVLLRQNFDRERNARGGYSDFDQLRAAARWLCAAQDSQNDGGFAGRYRLDRGWTSSYPETTGYLIPTFLALDKALPGAGYAARAARAVDFLLRIQLDSGAFPAMEIADNRNEPSPFNTGQILNGLTAWHRATGDGNVHDAAERAARWLVGVQDDDGSYRKHTYLGLETTYTAHFTCWLAEWGEYAGDEACLKAAGRHLDWVMRQAKPNGWIDKMGFDHGAQALDQAFTHTIAYTLAGVLATSVVLKRQDGIDLVTRGAEALARLTELKRRLPGVISNWQSRSDGSCLTGNAQTALIWFRLHRMKQNLRFVNAALKAIDIVKSAQPIGGRNAGISGGIPGSDAIDGPYIPNAFPNWAAKFFIDALLEKQAVLHDLSKAHPEGPRMESIELSPAAATSGTKPHIVFLTRIGSPRVPAMLKGFGDMPWGRLTVVVARDNPEPPLSRIEQRLRKDGFGWLKRRLTRGRTKAKTNGSGRDTSDLAAFCRERGIKLVETGPLDRPEAITLVQALSADLGIVAGGPILKNDLIACFRLGVLNSHMAMLPAYRGVSVAEWAALEGATAGCSVHLVNDGIDTGPLLARRALDVSDCRSVSALHAQLDEVQIALLAEAVRSTLLHGAVPQARNAPEPEGPQYFRMHRELAALVHRRLEVQVWN